MPNDQGGTRDPRRRWRCVPVGPGIVLVGSVMGAGELINVPVQAARFGFVLLWAVLLACVIKLFLQVEIGRHCLAHGRTTVEALNQCPGPKFRGTSWTALLYLAGYFGTMLTVVGMIAALGGLLHSVWPLSDSAEQSVKLWGILTVFSAAVLIGSGSYRQLEFAVGAMVGVFSISAIVAVALLHGTQYSVTWTDLQQGLSLSLGDDLRLAALAVVGFMGALGVTSNELFMYPYWILEKGLGRELGDPEEHTWTQRVRQRVRLLWIDASISTVLATVVTAAFFILGAGILHRRGSIPDGIGVVHRISHVYTESYGNWSYYLFLIGAFCVLFSTLVVVAAASGRMWCDLLGSLGYIDRSRPETVQRCHQVVQFAWLAGLLAAFLCMPAGPVWMVLAGQFFTGAVMTPLFVFCICWLAFRTDARARMGTHVALALIASAAIIVVCVLIGLVALVKQLQ